MSVQSYEFIRSSPSRGLACLADLHALHCQFGINSEFALSIRYLFGKQNYQFGNLDYQFGIFSANDYHSGVIFYHSGAVFYLFGKIFRNTGLILCLSGLIIPKLQRVCRYFPKLLIAILSFRYQFDDFPETFPRIFESFTRLPERYRKNHLIAMNNF